MKSDWFKLMAITHAVVGLKFLNEFESFKNKHKPIMKNAESLKH